MKASVGMNGGGDGDGGRECVRKGDGGGGERQ